MTTFRVFFYKKSDVPNQTLCYRLVKEFFQVASIDVVPRACAVTLETADREEKREVWGGVFPRPAVRVKPNEQMPVWIDYAEFDRVIIEKEG